MVNFQVLTKKLHDRGWTDERIAQKLGCARTAVYALRTGKNREPRYSLGAGLVALELRTRKRRK